MLTLTIIAAMATAIAASSATVVTGSVINGQIEKKKEREFKHSNPDGWQVWNMTHKGQSLLPPQLALPLATTPTEQLSEESFGPDDIEAVEAEVVEETTEETPTDEPTTTEEPAKETENPDDDKTKKDGKKK